MSEEDDKKIKKNVEEQVGERVFGEWNIRITMYMYVDA